MPETVIVLTPPELAKRWKCSERKLERHREAGDGPAYLKFGATIRYQLAVVEQYETDNLVRSTSEPASPGLRRKRPGLRSPSNAA